ncbi:UNVERIFIED_CONTAM: hypothetical protein HDU68_006485 [Siphonaria sp. JEL0065]|nr:hypothetical protein HDU68_006485 [Siphonaria sp. JEL0065]
MSLSSCLSSATSSVQFSGSSVSLFSSSMSFGANKRAIASNGVPQAFTYPANENEAAAIIKCAAQYNATVSPRCGGHSYEGFSIVNQAVIIDLSSFTEVTVDAASQTAIVGAGNWLGRVYNQLELNGRFVLPGGTCPGVGVSGHTLGGGYGLLSRKLGIPSDAVLEVRLIDATGTLKTVNAQTDSELFWALRGAGANNFGLVTSFKFKVFPLPPVLSMKQYSWENTVANRQALITGFTTYGPSLPNEITSTIYVDSTYLSLNVYYWGPLSGIDSTVSSFLSKLPAGRNNGNQGEYSGYLDLILFLGKTTRSMIEDRSQLQESDWFKASSLYGNSAPSSDAINALTEGGPIAIGSVKQAFVMLDLWGGAISSVDASATAFVHRDKNQVGYQLWWGWNSGSDELPAFNKWRASVATYIKDGSYQNYVDRTVSLVDYYGKEGLSKLGKVKARMDPLGLWKYEGGVPASAGTGFGAVSGKGSNAVDSAGATSGGNRLCRAIAIAFVASLFSILVV